MPVDLLALSGWILLLVVLAAAAMLIGWLTGRLFLRAAGKPAHRR